MEALSIEREEKAVQADLADWSGIMTYAEFRHGKVAPVSFELLGIGRQLADQQQVKLSAILLGSGLGDAARDFLRFSDPVCTHRYRTGSPDQLRISN